MAVTVRIVGGETREVGLESPTAADLLAAVDRRPGEATVLVDGRPVAEDARIDADAVEVLPLVRGG